MSEPIFKFTDTAGRDWFPKVTVGTIKRIKEAHGVLLTELLDGAELSIRFRTDFLFLVEVLWECCCEQGDRLGIDGESFANELGGETLREGTRALEAAICHFIQPPEKGAAMLEIIRKQEAIELEAARVAMSEAKKVEPRSAARECIDYASSSREQSESIPALSR